MNTFVDSIHAAIGQRAAGQGDGVVACQAPEGHLLAQQAIGAALDAAKKAGQACLEAVVGQTDPQARVVVHFSDPLEDLPYGRFAPYQTREIIAVWQPVARYQSADDYTQARKSLVERLQPLVLVQAFEGDPNEWNNITRDLGVPIHDLSMSMEQALERARARLVVSNLNGYLTNALVHELPNMRGLPQQVVDGVAYCAAALARIPPVEHDAYQQRMAKLPDEIAQGLGGVIGSARAQDIGEAIYTWVASANTPIQVKLSRNRASRNG